MKQTPAGSHATHDELLIARLYGGDVNTEERAHALDQVAGCEDCAALFADLGAVAAAMPAMVVPPRPRDFTLAPRDAQRLRPRSGAFGFARWSRPLGAALSGLGAAALVLFGVVSMLPSASTVSAPTNAFSERGGAGGVIAIGSQAAPAALCPPVCNDTNQQHAPAVASGAVASPAASAAVASPVAPAAVTSPVAGSPVPKGGAGNGPVPAPSGGHAAPTAEPAQSQNAPAPVDPRIALGAAAVLLLAGGLALLVAGFVVARTRA